MTDSTRRKQTAGKTEETNDPLVKQIQQICDSDKYPHVLSYHLPHVMDGAKGETYPPWKKLPRSLPHPLHSMMSRGGSFPPALARYFIVGYSQPGDLVFDPFCGKGTTVLQAVLDGRKAVGSDVAPEAVIASRAKVTPVALVEIESYLKKLKIVPQPIEHVPDRVKIFFHDETLSQLLGVRDKLIDDSKRLRGCGHRVAGFLLGCLLGILHGHASYSLSLQCSHAFAMAPNYVRKYARQHGLRKPRRDVLDCLLQRSRVLLSKSPVPSNRGQSAKVFRASAQRYPSAMQRELGGGVSLIVTSPPYLNAQTYAKDAWLRLWLLGYDYRDLNDQFIQTGSIEKYKLLMRPCLAEMLRVLKPGADAFLVAGDVYQRRKGQRQLVKTAEILAEIAESLLPQDNLVFDVSRIIDDTIPNHTRYYAAVHGDANKVWDHNGQGTGVRIDRIVHLRKMPKG